MEKRRKNPATSKIKKKMTREQLQLAILRKKECDAKALTIVERLLEPDVDPAWLVENLKDINKCHMEDVIEERAIIKLCGYVLCQNPLVVVYNQRYHISLKDKKVYDITKRKNFCSSSCFGASNYLLEQMLTSPLWLRENEDIPKFRIFHVETKSTSNISTQGEKVDIAAAAAAVNQEKILQAEAEKEISECIENFVLEAVQNFELKDMHTSSVDKTFISPGDQHDDGEQETKTEDIETSKKEFQAGVEASRQSVMMKNKIKLETGTINKIDLIEKDENTCIDDGDIIEQCVYPIENNMNDLNESFDFKKNHIDSEDIIEQSSYPVDDKDHASSFNMNSQSHDEKVAQEIDLDGLAPDLTLKVTKKKKEKTCKKPVDINLAARVESSFHEWITDQTVDYLFGDESVKKKVTNKMEIQEKHRILCGKLDRLQVQEDREDADTLGRTALKPAPHFAVLKEEGQKLDLKVRAFLEGKTSFEEPPKSNVDEEATENVDTFLPLSDIHGPQILRRKIFLEKLDQVLPDLLRTLAGNNDVYARASTNYSSVRSTAVKALIHTFSLSAKNIIFKTAEWTLVGLVIIKMLSLSDPYLASLLATKQANLYVSMILTAYKLDSDYLNLLVASFNPNMNPR